MIRNIIGVVPLHIHGRLGGTPKKTRHPETLKPPSTLEEIMLTFHTLDRARLRGANVGTMSGVVRVGT